MLNSIHFGMQKIPCCNSIVQMGIFKFVGQLFSDSFL